MLQRRETPTLPATQRKHGGLRVIAYRHVYTRRRCTYLLDLVAGADGFASGCGHLVGLLDRGRLIVVVVIVATVDDAIIVVGSHQRVRLVHPGVLRFRNRCRRRNDDGGDSKDAASCRCEETDDLGRISTSCDERDVHRGREFAPPVSGGNQPSDFGALGEKTPLQHHGTIPGTSPSSARSGEAGGTKAPHRGNPRRTGIPARALRRRK